MERREFLGRLGVSAAALAGGAAGAGVGGVGAGGSGALAAAAPEEPSGKSSRVRVPHRLPGKKFQLSLAAYSFRDLLSGEKPKMSLDDFIDFCAVHSLDATELTSYYFRQEDRAYLASLRRRASVNGLAISGTPIGSDYCVPAGPKREEQLAHTRKWIEHASLLGADTIRVFAGRVGKGQTKGAALDLAVEGLKEMSAYAGEHGVLLALENHGGVTALVEDHLAIVERVASPWLGVNLDTGNYHTKVYESLARAAPYAVAVQVKVETREGKGPKLATDWERMGQILDDAGYRGYVALEYESAPDPRLAVPKYLKKLRAALGR